MTDEFREKLVETLEAIVDALPIGKTATHLARDRLESLREIHEASKREDRNG